MGSSFRTHERVVNKHCSTCGASKGHRYVEVKSALWLRLVLAIFTFGIGNSFLKKWKTQCSGCGTLN